MTDKEIIKAAECCLNNGGYCPSECPGMTWSTWSKESPLYRIKVCRTKFCEFIIEKSKQSEGNKMN